MTKFRKLGFISRCNGSLQVHSSLLSILLRDTPNCGGLQFSASR
jgi:hypothetical protein